jgi:3-phosphoshikimate 1-carboxyvinyltransferase
MRCITNLQNFIDCTVGLPLSKSILNRLLVIRYLSGATALDVLFSESSDTQIMQDLLFKIGSENVNDESGTEINVGNAGTVMRFLTAVLAITPGHWVITGSERMQQRPIRPLSDALISLGSDISFGNIPSYPPLIIKGNPLLSGGTVNLDAGISSQFISALMMLGPVLKDGLVIELQGDIISGSYIHMTCELMQKAGAIIDYAANKIQIKEGTYNPVGILALVEPDWSAAAFWYEVAAFASGAKIMLKGLKEKSVQGDSILPEIYKNLGVTSVFTEDGLLLTRSEEPSVAEYNFDFTECPDLAQAVIVTCAALGIKGCFSGLKTLRVKETDRIEALRNELTKLGYGVDVNMDQICLSGSFLNNRHRSSPAVVNCYDDHRMAMSFAPLALMRSEICLDDPDVVKKSYPAFWEDMAQAGFLSEE